MRLLFLVFFHFVIISFLKGQDHVKYTDSLKFDQKLFKTVSLIDSSSVKVAEVATNLLLEPGELKNDTLMYSVYSIMFPEKSWINIDFVKNQEVLIHEKYHFLITEIYARKLRKALSEKTFRYFDYLEEIKREYQRIDQEWRTMQVLYDLETKHSADREKQKKWEKCIDKQLEKLKAYSNSLIYIKLEPLKKFNSSGVD